VVATVYSIQVLYYVLRSQVRGTQAVIDTVLVFDTIRSTVIDTTHYRIVDTVGAVLPQDQSTGTLALQLLIALATAGAGIAAAIASWRSAISSGRNADAAKAAASAATTQAIATREQAALQREQIALVRERDRAAALRSAQALKALVRRIRFPLKDLNESAPRHSELRNYNLLSDADVAQLETLAASVSAEAIAEGAKAAVALRYIVGLIMKAKSINEGTGWVPSTDERENWEVALGAVETQLTKLATICDGVATS